jgi:hypothetical protein
VPATTGLPKESVANVSQVVAVDRELLTERIGSLSSRQLSLVLSGHRHRSRSLAANQMSDAVIKVENLSKKYLLSHQRGERYVALRDVIARGGDVSVEVERMALDSCRDPRLLRAPAGFSRTCGRRNQIVEGFGREVSSVRPTNCAKRVNANLAKHRRVSERQEDGAVKAITDVDFSAHAVLELNEQPIVTGCADSQGTFGHETPLTSEDQSV